MINSLESYLQFMHIHYSKASLKDKYLSKEQNQDTAGVCVTT